VFSNGFFSHSCLRLHRQSRLYMKFLHAYMASWLKPKSTMTYKKQIVLRTVEIEVVVLNVALQPHPCILYYRFNFISLISSKNILEHELNFQRPIWMTTTTTTTMMMMMMISRRHLGMSYVCVVV
jgi:hypothetical protein